MKIAQKWIALFFVLTLTACSAGDHAYTNLQTPTALEVSEVISVSTEVTPEITAESNAPEVASVSSGVFTLTSPDVIEGRRLPIEYTCDGDGSTLPLVWSGAPIGTVGYGVLMDHIAAPEDIHWYWVLFDIPADVTSLAKNVTGIGTLGNNINNGLQEYSPPCSKGPGDKTYTYTVFALSAQPQFSVPAAEVDRITFLAAIQNITLGSAQLNVVYARAGMTDPSGTVADNPPQNQPGAGNNPQGGNGQTDANGNSYNVEQAISDRAQSMTIAYDALAFLTGDVGANSFFPPGKVSDFWGFQYLRDNDPSEMGHAGAFLTSAAMNMLNVLSVDQRAKLVGLAESQVAQINEYGYKRFVLVQAFQNLLDGNLSTGMSTLSEEQVKAYSAELYLLDGEISYARAALMGSLLNAMSAEQLALLDGMVGKGMLEWPEASEPSDIQGLSRDAKVAVMTYAADMFAWYAGSVEADVYFCPERHGTYFGSFYLKDIKAMSDPNYAIPTDMTGNMGEEMLGVLNVDQAQLITGLVDIQRPSLEGIVEIREAVSTELRKFLTGGTADKAVVLDLMRQYGELDGEIIYNMATNFSAVNASLSSQQAAQLDAMRTELLGELSHPGGAYLYSQAIPMPDIPSSDFLFQ